MSASIKTKALIRCFIFFLIIILICFAAFILLIKDKQAYVKNIDSQGDNIVCFGNSLTLGYGASPGKSYPDILRDKLEMQVINAGVNGDTTIEALERLERDVLRHDPRLVIVEFGGNDFLRKVPKETTIKNLEEIVREIQGAGAMVVLVEVRTGLLGNYYVKNFERIAKENEALFIPDVLKGILSDFELKHDAIHPNDKGYAIMAERILRKIKPLLKNMKLKSTAFEQNQFIPRKYTCEGEDINPPLQFERIPENAKSLVLIVDDPDAPGGDWVHWVVFNIDPSVSLIKENEVPKGAVQGINDFNKCSYGGPCPPSGVHHYYFKAYALDKLLELDKDLKKSDVLAEMEGHILEKAELIGLYERQ